MIHDQATKGFQLTGQMPAGQNLLCFLLVGELLFHLYEDVRVPFHHCQDLTFPEHHIKTLKHSFECHRVVCVKAN